MCQEFGQCYDDVNICLWTNGSDLTRSAAQAACQRRNSFLPRVTNSRIQSKLAEFRSDADRSQLIYGRSFWIDVSAVTDNDWHWIDNSPFAGLCVCANRTKHIDKNKTLSYRRETALQGALVLAKSKRLELGDNILRTLYRSIFKNCDIICLQSYLIRWKNAK